MPLLFEVGWEPRQNGCQLADIAVTLLRIEPALSIIRKPLSRDESLRAMSRSGLVAVSSGVAFYRVAAFEPGRTKSKEKGRLAKV